MPRRDRVTSGCEVVIDDQLQVILIESHEDHMMRLLFDFEECLRDYDLRFCCCEENGKAIVEVLPSSSTVLCHYTPSRNQGGADAGPVADLVYSVTALVEGGQPGEFVPAPELLDGAVKSSVTVPVQDSKHLLLEITDLIGGGHGFVLHSTAAFDVGDTANAWVVLSLQGSENVEWAEVETWAEEYDESQPTDGCGAICVPRNLLRPSDGVGKSLMLGAVRLLKAEAATKLCYRVWTTRMTPAAEGVSSSTPHPSGHALILPPHPSGDALILPPQDVAIMHNATTGVPASASPIVGTSSSCDNDCSAPGDTADAVQAGVAQGGNQETMVADDVPGVPAEPPAIPVHPNPPSEEETEEEEPRSSNTPNEASRDHCDVDPPAVLLNPPPSLPPPVSRDSPTLGTREVLRAAQLSSDEVKGRESILQSEERNWKLGVVATYLHTTCALCHKPVPVSASNANLRPLAGLVVHQNCAKLAPQCTGCKKIIIGKYLVRVHKSPSKPDEPYHVDCRWRHRAHTLEK